MTAFTNDNNDNSNQEYNEMALELYWQLSSENINIYNNNLIHLLALKACANLKDFENGKLIYSQLNETNGGEIRNKLKAEMEFKNVINMESYQEAINLIRENKDNEQFHVLNEFIKEFKS